MKYDRDEGREFKAGDRVRLRLRPGMGNDEPMRSSMRAYKFSLGNTGTILKDGDHYVAWDNGNHDPGWDSPGIGGFHS